MARKTKIEATDPVDDAKAKLEADRVARVKRVTTGLTALLKENRCAIEPVLTITTKGQSFAIKIVSME